MDWLQKEARGKEIFSLIIFCTCFNLVYGFFAILVTNFFQVKIETVDEYQFVELVKHFPVILILAAFLEEVIFRLPLVIFIKLKLPIAVILIVALISSVFFGLIHGGILTIFIQGVFGFGFCILFLKCGGLQGRYLKALTVTTVTHALFNTILCFLILVG